MGETVSIRNYGTFTPAASNISSAVSNRREVAATRELDSILQIAKPKTASVATQTSVSLPAVMEDASMAAEKAESCGVDLARRGFMVKLCGLAIAGLGLGIAVAVTALTAGAGTPLLVLAGVGFALALADTSCALYDWRSRAGGGTGLPMEGNAIANGVYVLARKLNANEETAGKVATYTSMGVRSALTVANILTGFFNPVSAAGSVAHAMTILGTLVRPLATEAGALVTGSTVPLQVAKQTADLAAMAANTKQMVDADHQQETAQYKQLIETLRQELESLKARMAERDIRGHQSRPLYGFSTAV
ncbi:hypothetical protein [Chitinimonas sp. BJB300]|uniref:hypothetical protein n=1 Tax=Chitinimonas sp. BJB300 TaxID=1559339 RepID=UPI000C10BB78|nr:hypothetical protein [Chitinimonas sp. BJB300]PHV11471.1 hypothetical protein CSQ89_10585 [Chitinimonas sp. BJB300]TSJ88532.1 hypothetical protein FG002_010200 [Chitinimonas sp. BJB300]